MRFGQFVKKGNGGVGLFHQLDEQRSGQQAGAFELRAQAPAMLAMAETVWLQMGPTMRALYGRLRRTEPPQFHRLIITALRAGDEPGLRLAVRSDVTQGLRMLAS